MIRPACRLWATAVLAVCCSMIASCAVRPLPQPAPARLTIPAEVLEPCRIARLPVDATLADLEAAYMERGVQLVACDGARALALELLLAERTAVSFGARQD